MEGMSALAVGVAVLSSAHAKSPSDTHWVLEGFGGYSITNFLGTEDHRQTMGFSLHHTRPERRFRIRGTDAELGVGAYMGFSHSSFVPQDPPNSTTEVGVVAFARWLVKAGGSARLYGDLGWGFQYTNRRTHDLDSRLNSTPFIGAGLLVPAGTFDWMLGARLMHISNGGTVGHNRGENQVWFTVGLRF